MSWVPLLTHSSLLTDHRPGDETSRAGSSAIRGHALPLLPYLLHAPGRHLIAGARGACVRAYADAQYSGQIKYTVEVDARRSEWLEDGGREQGWGGLVEIHGLVGKSGDVGSLRCREEELLKEQGQGLLDLRADRRGTMQVDEDRSEGRRACTLVVPAAKGVFRAFDRWYLEGHPET